MGVERKLELRQGTGDWLAETTGVQFLEWIGKVGTWQYAIAIGGVILAIAAGLRLFERLGASGRKMKGEGIL